MPNVSYDGQSFQVDGRRIWLVSGSIHYPRTPRDQWRDRIRAAKQAGLNCIETYVFWNLHEPRPGVFDFKGEKDLRHFVELIAEEGMFCMFRPGPYVCSEWDFGGLPAWLNRVESKEPMKLREASGPFLEALSRYLGAVMGQVKDLQVSSTATAARSAKNAVIGGGNGPIIMVQAENEWFCHNPKQSDIYLRENVRYLRENGVTVPINMCNNLWARLDGVIDTWNGSANLATDLRQLHVVQPQAPRIMTEYWPGWFDQWNAPHGSKTDADTLLYRMAAILAAGAQPNLYMFHGGTNFAFWGGRTVASPDCFMTTSYDYDAPLKEAGGRGAKYLATKRISVFASQFGHIFAALDPDVHPTSVALSENDHCPAVVEQTGPQGKIVFVFKARGETLTDTRLMLPNGLSLPVPLGEDNVAWLLLDANLAGVAELTYTNLRPWAFLGKRMLVLFGPAGADGIVAINGARFDVKVPEGQTPLVEQHEELTVVVLNRQQVDAAYILPGGDGLVIGVANVDDPVKPEPLAGWPKTMRIGVDGKVSTTAAQPARKATPPRLTKWQWSPLTDLLSGESDAFRPIAGPMSHDQLGCDYGYGLYRFDLASKAADKVLAPQLGDRLHVYQQGNLLGLLGFGVGAEYDPVKLPATGQVVALSDNMGRFNYGWHLGEVKGLAGHLHAVKPMKLGSPRITRAKAPDPFVLRGFWNVLRAGEQPVGDHLTWTVKITGKQPVILDVQNVRARAMILVNGQPLDMYDYGQRAHYGRWVLEVGQQLKPGNNELTFALFRNYDAAKDKAAVLAGIKLYRSDRNVSTGDWAFAPLPLPKDADFATAPKRTPTQPCWWRCSFTTPSADVPLWLEPTGLSKGQLYLNGHNVGRYWVATATGKNVPPQSRYYLPEAWLRTDRANELLIFEEHGKSPAKARLVYDPMGPYGE